MSKQDKAIVHVLRRLATAHQDLGKFLDVAATGIEKFGPEQEGMVEVVDLLHEHARLLQMAVTTLRPLVMAMSAPAAEKKP